MAQAGHKSVVSRNARKRTRAGGKAACLSHECTLSKHFFAGRKRSASTKFKSSSRGDSILVSYSNDLRVRNLVSHGHPFFRPCCILRKLWKLIIPIKALLILMRMLVTTIGMRMMRRHLSRPGVVVCVDRGLARLQEDLLDE